MKTLRNCNNAASPDGDDRKTKRSRTGPACRADDEETPALPPEIWAIVMGCLPYGDVLSASAVSRTMLRDVMPRLETLHVLKASELHVGPTGRFTNAKDVNIYCLVKFPGNAHNRKLLSIDGDAAGRAVPFLCRFPQLERAFLGGLIRDVRSRKWNGVVGYIPDSTGAATADGIWHRKRNLMRSLIVALSGAFRSGALPSKAWIMGIRCPDSNPRNEREGCSLCREACRSFPVGQVIDFEHQGSSEAFYKSGDSMCSFDFCLPRDEIMRIVEKCPGGIDLLRSPKRFLDILGRGTRHVIEPDDGNTVFVVKYDDETVEELKACISYGIDPAKLKRDDVVRAIMRSFADDERDPAPPTEQCHLASSSFSMLKGLGLPVTESDFVRNERDIWCSAWRFY